MHFADVYANSGSESHLYLVFDTNQYAGNFERDLLGYVTGLKIDNEDGYSMRWRELGQRELGMADYDDGPFGAYIGIGITEHDGMGIATRVSIWHNLEGIPNSVAFFLESVPPDRILAAMLLRAHKFAESYSGNPYLSTPSVALETPLKILGVRIVTETRSFASKKVQ